ncbi:MULTISPECIES: hypothetical protein [Brevibacillus]|jgi:hypothetical protein|uniref:Uncharacterized protein n=1 Tax=Brevibacillus parabrevis TaxID=54914 RepID=A0A4Y3PJP8_BREPA|nr:MULTISPECIES: hypothetical protein [Brevibacillus]KZE48848.1 hypothetical protein AV540_16435 [Brevibacillus parabrevis]MBU8712821.1 hypothetical protein [Brevibacillus parabrevis]MDH6348329.1 hypothetical protein [Brevibacillus sp. 1238]MDR5000469.1 hypothetical protein [Brevibacillus parabrevis]NRQ52844.1 hypothetical protein [Brevibacillus sp. HD1.4A]
MNQDDLHSNQNSIHLEKLYKDIDEQSAKFFHHNYQHYLDENVFPEDACSIPQDIDLSAATIVLGELKWEWTEIELLSRLSLLGAEIGINRPIPVLDFFTLLEGKSVVWSKYCDHYIENFESLINCLKRFIPDQDESSE